MASTDEIKMNLDQVEKNLEALKTCKTTLMKLHEEMKKEHSNLKDNWKGTSGDSFSQCSTNIEKNLQGRIDGLQILIGYLEDSITDFCETDKNLYVSNS